MNMVKSNDIDFFSQILRAPFRDMYYKVTVTADSARKAGEA